MFAESVIFIDLYQSVTGRQSPSMRGRGLKQVFIDIASWLLLSPSMRGRGLKLLTQLLDGVFREVALHAGAWIETATISQRQRVVSCRPPCGGVD